ncbi:hypothetical protein ScPMuIL_007865 [Solemya velum]
MLFMNMYRSKKYACSSGVEDDTTAVFGWISSAVKVRFEPIGRWYEALCLRLDPKEWKNQDHYAVLGLSRLRYKATDEQIKRAYKKKVLKHHPDKRKARGLSVRDGEDDYFTCITRAYEILGTPLKKRSFDSVDPLFDDLVPQGNCLPNKDNFYEVFRPVFETNSRWSTKKRVPQLGDENTPFSEVNNFYSFWYEFDSWREYSYLDEEEKEKGENREERRWIEKQNKATRQKRKKEEVARIRQLVDNAYACDPRIQKYKDDEREKKLAQKRAKQEAARQKAEEEEKKKQQALEEERQKREKEEEEAKAQAAVLKKEKEAQKKIFKRERKILRTTMKDFEYFATEEVERVANMAEVERLADLLSLTRLQKLNEAVTSGDKGKAKGAFHAEVEEMKKEIEREKLSQLEALKKHSSGDGSQKNRKVWSETEVSMLIKGVNLFPAGTKDRWEVIASFIKQHVTDSNKNAKDVLAKAKDLQKNDMALKEDAQRNAFQNFEKEHQKSVAKPKEGVVSERFESIAEQQIRETGTNPAPWTAEEQKSLEQSLKTFPANTPDRWDRIAESVPSRSKKDCMKRYKELVELVRAKKAAQDAAAKEKKS